MCLSVGVYVLWMRVCWYWCGVRVRVRVRCRGARCAELERCAELPSSDALLPRPSQAHTRSPGAHTGARAAGGATATLSSPHRRPCPPIAPSSSRAMRSCRYASYDASRLHLIALEWRPLRGEAGRYPLAKLAAGPAEASQASSARPASSSKSSPLRASQRRAQRGRGASRTDWPSRVLETAAARRGECRKPKPSS